MKVTQEIDQTAGADGTAQPPQNVYPVTVPCLRRHAAGGLHIDQRLEKRQ